MPIAGDRFEARSGLVALTAPFSAACGQMTDLVCFSAAGPDAEFADRLLDRSRLEGVNRSVLAEVLLGLPPGSSDQQVMTRLLALVAVARSSPGSDQVLALGALQVFAPEPLTGLARANAALSAQLQFQGRPRGLATYGATDRMITWQDLAAGAGHPNPGSLSGSKAFRFVQETLSAQAVVTFQDLGALFGMLPTATRDEVVAEFKRVRQILDSTEGRRLQPGEEGFVAVYTALMLGLDALHRHQTRPEVRGLARANAALERELNR